MSKVCVARTVSRQEVKANHDANEACLAEWDRLEGQRCWDKEVVEEKRDLIAIYKGINTVHFGKLAEICVEKGSELDKHDPHRKYKGRVVFLGDRVKDTAGRPAVFEELSSSPAALEAGKLADLYGCLTLALEAKLENEETSNSGEDSVTADEDNCKGSAPANKGNNKEQRITA